MPHETDSCCTEQYSFAALCLIGHAAYMQSASQDDVWDTRSRLTAATIGLAAFLTNFDVTSVVVAMPSIGADLAIDVGNLAWIIDAYSIAFTVTLLVAGALADRFGRRRCLLSGNACFLAASLACGLAGNSALFLVARAVQGAAAAFLVTGGFASIATAFPEQGPRARAFGIVGVVSGIAMALGPSVGGIIASWLGWRWIFLANLPFCALIAVLTPRLVAEFRDGSDKPMDWSGVAILTLALALVIEAILEARHSLIHLAAGLAAGAVLITLFAVRQRRHPKPMFDPAIFASRPIAGVAVLLMTVSTGYWAVLVYLPLFLNAGFGWSSERAGVGMLVATLPMLVIPPFGSRLAFRVGWRRLFAWALTLIGTGGCALAIAAVTQSVIHSLVWTFAGMLLIGVGAALSHPQLSGAVIALMPPKASGMASAITVIARQSGFAVGVAALGALTPVNLSMMGFAWPFGFATAASVCGAFACRLLPKFLPAEKTGHGREVT